ncbi:major centromere autoantigen B [Triticum aestivum]|uniref:major centromere autoantigen B n=1 Tax=Triticum aestivum TaxID=4565 RepID=UPI001D01C6AA|nr:major centromere autoantigen B-like [Triticum aestivum]
MGDWKRKSIAGGPSPSMGDWKRRSIAGGPSPETPNEIISGALHLDFFYRPGAAGVAFPIDRADQNGGQRRMAVTPPATVAPPLQGQQCQPAGTAPTGGSGLRPGGRRLRIKVPSASQLPPLPEDLAYLFTNVEFYSDDGEEAREEEEEEAMLLWSSEEEEDGETMSSGSSEEEGGDGEDMSSGRSEEDEEDGEDMSSGRSGEGEDWEDMSSGPSEGEEEDREGMSSGRSEEEEAGQEEMEEEAGQDEMEEEAGPEEMEQEAGEEEAMLSGHNEDDQVDVEAMLYCHEGEEALLSQNEEGEEEPEEVQAMCERCDSLERLVTLLPCRHASYCERCFAIVDRRQGAGRLCAVCWQPYARGHPQSGGLQPKPKKSSK